MQGENGITQIFDKVLKRILLYQSNTSIVALINGKHGKFDYPVPAIKFLNYSVEEICEKQMTALLPDVP